MFSRWFNVVVVLFWLATMSWLVTTKVLPPVIIGEPPTYRTIVEDHGRHPEGEVGWTVFWDDREIGTATSKALEQDEGVTRFESHVQLADFPLAEASPVRIGALTEWFQGPGGGMRLETESVAEVDPLGRLIHFEVALRLGDLDERILLRGVVEGTQLVMTLRVGEFAQHAETYLAPNSIVADAFSPQQRLPNLRAGQSWTVPVYNPFRAQSSPMEILQARVVGDELLVWNGRAIWCWVVEYRPDEGAGLHGSDEPKARLWVARDGLVVQQDMAFGSSWLRFVRQSSAPDAGQADAAVDETTGF